MTHERTLWEYRTVLADTQKSWWKGGTVDFESFNAHLNTLGRDGWELVSVVPTSGLQGQTNAVAALLKRARR